MFKRRQKRSTSASDNEKAVLIPDLKRIVDALDGHGFRVLSIAHERQDGRDLLTLKMDPISSTTVQRESFPTDGDWVALAAGPPKPTDCKERRVVDIAGICSALRGTGVEILGVVSAGPDLLVRLDAWGCLRKATPRVQITADVIAARSIAGHVFMKSKLGPSCFERSTGTSQGDLK